jgi:hypothetical protein
MEREKLQAGARLSVVWLEDEPDQPVDALDHVASYARALVEALRVARWHPHRLEIALQLPSSRVIDLEVEGEVPGLDQAGFAKLSSIAIASCNLWQALPSDAEIRLRARLIGTQPALLRPPRTHLLQHNVAPAMELPPPPPAPQRVDSFMATAPEEAPVLVGPAAVAAAPPDKPSLMTRIALAVLFGGLLGMFGLPRLVPQLELPTIAPAAPSLPTPASTEVTVQAATPVPTLPPPTLAPTPVPPTAVPPTAVPTVVVAAAPPATRVLFADRFVNPLPGWPNAPGGSAWFGDNSYQLVARDPGRFVAIETPIGNPVGDATVSARFRKTGGPPGGGYGLIVRNQRTAALDGENQLGRYLVFEVGDGGDIGIWQRDDARWIDLLRWTHSNAAHAGGEPNELMVNTEGRRLRFAVNGIEVANSTYEGIEPEGGVGIFVGGDLNEVTLEWMIVETPGSNVR